MKQPQEQDKNILNLLQQQYSHMSPLDTAAYNDDHISLGSVERARGYDTDVTFSKGWNTPVLDQGDCFDFGLFQDLDSRILDHYSGATSFHDMMQNQQISSPQLASLATPAELNGQE